MIEDFIYYTPTKVVFGRGAENKTGELVAGLGCKKTPLHYGGGSAERTGLLGRIRESLRRGGRQLRRARRRRAEPAPFARQRRDRALPPRRRRLHPRRRRRAAS